MFPVRCHRRLPTIPGLDRVLRLGAKDRSRQSHRSPKETAASANVRPNFHLRIQPHLIDSVGRYGLPLPRMHPSSKQLAYLLAVSIADLM